MENFMKETVLGRSSTAKGEISAVHPSRYAPRFVNFMKSYVVIDQHEGKVRAGSIANSKSRLNSDSQQAAANQV